MAQPDKCRVGGCSRYEAATVLADELPGPLRLCFAHTEQYRQSSEGWKIDWDVNASEPSSVFAPTAWIVAAGIPHAERPQVEPAGPVGGVAPASKAARMLRWTQGRRETKRGTPR